MSYINIYFCLYTPKIHDETKFISAESSKMSEHNAQQNIHVHDKLNMQVTNSNNEYFG